MKLYQKTEITFPDEISETSEVNESETLQVSCVMC